MTPIESLIAGSEKLTGITGRWPTFHDAEVIEFNLWRGDVNPDEDRWVFPTLLAKIHVWNLTQEVGANGCLVTRNHSLVTIRFNDVDELRLAGFNYQNAILSLNIERRERADGPSPYFFVDFNPAFGLEATFHCRSIEVLTAVPCPSTAQA